MGYHYIALVEAGSSGTTPQVSDGQVAFLRSLNMQSVPIAGPVALFVSSETPTLAVPGGVVIGHLFSKDGQPIKPEHLPAQTSAECFAEYMLANYWGEYVLFQPTVCHSSGLDILREPSGGVPCVYSYQENASFVTSDISLATGLGLHDWQIDWDFIAQSLVYPHVNTTRTGMAGVHELLPGCSLRLSGTSAKVREAWSPWVFVTSPHRHHDFRDAACEVRTTVDTVIKALAETDKTVLVELSGGLDSSIVAMCLQGTAAKTTCCNLVTPVPGADERQYARQIARALGIELHTEQLTFVNANFDFAPHVQTTRPRMSVLQYVFQEALAGAAKSQGATSFFSGGGGDTVFCYAAGAAPAADSYRETGLSAGLTAVRDLSTLHQCTYWKAGRLTLKKLLRGAKAPFKANNSFLNPSIGIPDLDRHPWFAAPAGTLPGDQERIADLAGTQVFRDGAPRGSTHWLRLPLLSQPVMEACLKAPSWMWITGGENRAIARAAFADRLPRGVLERRSKGTFMNYFGAIYERSKPQLREYLLTGHLQARGLLDAKALTAFFGTALPPRDTSFMRTFDLCMIENWIRHQG
ncbi:MAG TPA: asparagine synthase-related protein [Rhodanobacter sp.]